MDTRNAIKDALKKGCTRLWVFRAFIAKLRLTSDDVYHSNFYFNLTHSFGVERVLVNGKKWMRFAAIWHIWSGSNERTSIFILPAFSTLLLCFYIACVVSTYMSCAALLILVYDDLHCTHNLQHSHDLTITILSLWYIPQDGGGCINKSSDIYILTIILPFQSTHLEHASIN